MVSKHDNCSGTSTPKALLVYADEPRPTPGLITGVDIFGSEGGGSAPPKEGAEPSKARKRGRLKRAEAKRAAKKLGLGALFQLPTRSTRRGRQEDRPREAFESRRADPNAPKPLVVIDAPNVAMRCGRGKAFETAGIVKALAYYQKRGHQYVNSPLQVLLRCDSLFGALSRVVALLPEDLTNYDIVNCRLQEQKVRVA